MNVITILTPTYNRAHTLPTLYESLKSQDNQNFDWLIVDDGSTDETRSLIEGFVNENVVNIIYIYQSNGGKARALNTGFSKSKHSLIYAVVDSDDYLLPSATQIFNDYIRKYEKDKEIGGFFFLYNTSDGKLLNTHGDVVNEDESLTRYEYNNKYRQNDGCICYFNRAISKYKYPEYEGESYIGPTVIQMEMADDFKFVFSPEVVGVAEYLEGGISKSGRKLRLKNPFGMIHYSNLMMSKRNGIITQIKYAISIWPYAKIAKKNFLETLKLGDRPALIVLTFLPGLLLYFKWRKLLD
ncbi:glycosyltransferase family 2 protein [Virgibacillus halodenitrificans]|uniref:Glycosyltransferase family 2 protein n=2 Tax=Virgibacillus halodenitrificans TaxID=1482 RepID=A0ABR7VH77_VIRHA|nr:glycosyltransferase family 2 protein [Virgibacillus halodenitrificans]